jgi:hypothetical protein
MCSNFGLNLHPGRKPCALQWEWYRMVSRLWGKLRGRFFPKALYMYDGAPHHRRPRTVMGQPRVDPNVPRANPPKDREW